MLSIFSRAYWLLIDVFDEKFFHLFCPFSFSDTLHLVRILWVSMCRLNVRFPPLHSHYLHVPEGEALCFSLFSYVLFSFS